MPTVALLLLVIGSIRSVRLRGQVVLTLPIVALSLPVTGSIRPAWLRKWVVPPLLMVLLGQAFGPAPLLILSPVARIEFVESLVEVVVTAWLKNPVKPLP